MVYGINSAYSAQTASKLYVPVNKSSLLYSHFDHVSGVAAKKGQNGISISKIRILNTLIEHLSSIKNDVNLKTKPSSPDQIDSLIKTYQEQIKQTVKASEVQPYILSGNKPESGVLFSLDA